ncbi:MAG: hypothetical protein OQK04_10075 [Kangiellaceae bacterium]|nr:hypothetical protein [Kangiellaceae bacterium]MCW8999051.1 hypothetical protein [Kangiellaceae bacterium]
MIDAYQQKQILNRLSKGLPLCEHPYAELAIDYGVDEAEIINFLKRSLANHTLKRIGAVVNHHKLGYSSNAMVVWNVPDNRVDDIGELLGSQSKVTLCYQRPRKLPDWPYNLFTMIHGKCRQQVLDYLELIVTQNNLQQFQPQALFSTKQYKQTGASYYG